MLLSKLVINVSFMLYVGTVLAKDCSCPSTSFCCKKEASGDGFYAAKKEAYGVKKKAYGDGSYYYFKKKGYAAKKWGYGDGFYAAKKNAKKKAYGDGFYAEKEGYDCCACDDGYESSDDGWSCSQINECENPENWPCAKEDEGGFCIDTTPENVFFPKYRCGCKTYDGFIEDPSYPTDKHGAKHCLIEEKELTFSFVCPNENLIPLVTSINVTGDPDVVFNDKEKLEQVFQSAYEESLPSKCAFRSLENITMLGLLKENGEVISAPDIDLARYLQDAENLNGLFFNSTSELNNTGNDLLEFEDDDDDILNIDINIEDDDDKVDDDDDELNIDNNMEDDDDKVDDDDDNIVDSDSNVSFNFTIYIAKSMRCYGCSDDAKLLDDASRRALRSRNLEEDTSCLCEISDGTTEDAAVANIAPSVDIFLEELNKKIEEERIDSIKEVKTVEDKTGAENPFEPISDLPTMLEEPPKLTEAPIPAPEEEIDCPCPKTSFCSFVNASQKDFFKHPKVDNLFYNCTCNEGYDPNNNGWSCIPLDECDPPDDWPCEKVDQGGFCVDTFPEDSEFPKYKCGCRKEDGFVADPSYPPDEQGVKHCLNENNLNNGTDISFNVTNVTVVEESEPGEAPAN